MSSVRLFAIAVMAVLSAAAPLVPNPLGAAAEAATPAKAATIKIVNFDFSPGVVTVPVGATVTWINQDDDAHDIVADNKSFHSAPLDSGDSYSFTFGSVGTYGYHCGVHPRMVGKIVVVP
jgi:plastocyanin